jgi:hypothetical protein
MGRWAWSEHLRFVVRRGIVPWGLAAGVIASAVAMASALHERAGGKAIGAASIIIAGTVCFFTWCLLIGWAVGGVLWTTRHERQAARHPTAGAVGRNPGTHKRR